MASSTGLRRGEHSAAGHGLGRHHSLKLRHDAHASVSIGAVRIGAIQDQRNTAEGRHDVIAPRFDTEITCAEMKG